MSSLLSVQWGFSQPGEKLAFSPRTTSPLGIQASARPTGVPRVEPPCQLHAAGVASISSVSMAKLKKKNPHLTNAAKVRRWHAAWPRICFTGETLHCLNLVVNNLARILGKKKKQPKPASGWQPLHYLKSNISPLCHTLALGTGGDGSRAAPRAEPVGMLRGLTQPAGPIGGFPVLTGVWARSVLLCWG